MEPASGISKLHDFKKSVFFRATCNCGSKDHDHDLVVEIDEADFVTVSIYSELSYCDWRARDRGWFSDMWSRIRAAAIVIFTGYLKMDSDFIFGTTEQTRDYANAILKAADELEARRLSALSKTTG